MSAARTEGIRCQFLRGQGQYLLDRDSGRIVSVAVVSVIRPGERATAGIVARHVLGRRLGGRL